MRDQSNDTLGVLIQKVHKRSLMNSSILVGIISIALVSLFLFSTWNTLANVMPHHPIQLKHVLVIPAHAQVSIPTVKIKHIAQEIHDELIASQIDHLLINETKHQQFSGSVLLAHNGHILLSKGYSMARWNSNQPNTPNTRFYLGSTTKQFTAMAILLLQQEGKLNVHNSICTYISPCPQAWWPITLHEILTHTSGIPGVDDTNLSSVSPKAWINSFNSFGLWSRPGSLFSYCNVCYQILGYVVERVSGMPYSAFLQHAIFGPLHMQNTGFNPDYTANADHADGYDAWEDADELSAWNLNPRWSFLFGAGLLYSTVEDMYRWDQALLHFTRASQNTVKAAFTPYATSQYVGSQYGYGWFLAHSPVHGHQLIWHDGKIPGFRTYNAIYPQDGVTFIILSNLATLDEIALAGKIQKMLFAHI